MKPMKHVMVDLETLGTVPGCAILSVGAVYFDETGLGKEFYMVAHQGSCTEAGLKVSQDTLDWWAKQGASAKKVLEESTAKECVTITEVLHQFGKFLIPGAKVWGNGADFDNPILACAYDAVQLKQAWLAWNGRCYRTLKNIAPGPKLERIGTYHNALDDAKSQALHAIELFKLHPTLVMA